MFDNLAEKFQSLFSGLGSKKVISEDNITLAVRQVRLALLDADVNYSVASQFVKRVKEKALGEAVLKSVSPKEQFIDLVHQELIDLMGSSESDLHIESLPSVIMLCGLQGSGKTTHCVKLAHKLSKEEKKKVLIAACDLQRPAAILQLKQLAEKAEIEVFSLEGEKRPVKVAKAAIKKVNQEGFDVLIVDTAGRLHVDEPLMEELEQIKKTITPHEVLFVANATTGQDAVKTAEEFDKRVGITGSILTMLDGNARAGAAISIREVTKKPLKFEGVGEKLTDIQVFNPRSMADRILGMGDVINLVKKAKQHVSDSENEELEKKFKKAAFTYDDYLKQMGKIKKMGSIKSLLKMVPGFSQLGDIDVSDGEFDRLEAMILSMTLKERLGMAELIPSRRNRIARGSGCGVDEVNKMIKGFKRLKKMMKSMPKMKKSFLKDPNMLSHISRDNSSL